MKLLEIIQTVSPRQARVIDAIMEFNADLDNDNKYSSFETMMSPNRWDMIRMCKEHPEELEKFLEEIKAVKEKQEADYEYNKNYWKRIRTVVKEKNDK